MSQGCLPERRAPDILRSASSGALIALPRKGRVEPLSVGYLRSQFNALSRWPFAPPRAHCSWPPEKDARNAIALELAKRATLELRNG
jgi:hypothetical protein